ALEGYDCNCVEVLPGNGDGTLGSPLTTPLPYGLGGYAVAVADFNADGKLDAAVAGEAYPSYIVAILLGKGDGTFAANGQYAVSASPQSIAVGTFTADKAKLDLAVANTAGSSVSVLLGNGDGSFQEPVYYATPFPTWVTTANLDTDGKVDLAVANFGDVTGGTPGITVFRGHGDGTFRVSRFYPVGKEINYVASADFNGDHKPDLLPIDSLGYAVITLLNTGVASFSPTTPLNFKQQTVGTTSPPQAVKLTNSGATTLKISSIKSSSGFGVTSTCGSSVAAGANCTISATFSPTRKGAVQGTISIIDSASSKPEVIALLGTGT
ncbi:MAG TPA: FG-GAP-like repeat-containing protein, partial [Candidatus Binatia bacterium]|nr:FG-GAP-like repeat-containing protein [Candidatus Binatia bacterium]